MCGIVGLYLKNSDLQPKLGELFEPMLVEMTDRGPDSAGFAIYRNPVDANHTKFTLACDDPETEWKSLDGDLEKALNCDVKIDAIGDHAVLVTDAETKAVETWLRPNQAKG